MAADSFDRFRSVPSSRRPIPFWSWNGKLDPEELRRQAREMAAAGVGGFFMHARGGLETGYLGDEWMGCVDACLEEGAALGLDSWLYDEEGWPSGFAGGLVPARDEAFHGRWLVVSRNVRDAAAAAAAPGFLALYRVRADGSYDRVGPDVSPEGAELVSVGWKSTPHYIDVLNPDAVDAFIEETHERYRRRFPAAFRSVSGAGRPTAGATRVAGFFTDEPRFSGSIDRDPPWSLHFPERYREACGRDVLDVLVALFLPVAGHQKVRYDYYALASFLFVSSFTKRIGDWCRSRGCELTGHLMMEESVFVQAANTAGVMPHYEHLDVPGVDWLRRPIGTPVVPKQVGSAAAQLGKKRVVTESFALAGWDVDFEELKRIVEWQFVNGVNLLCQHLEAYTLRGFRKRDYPPSMFLQQPWWPEYRRFNDYVGRLGMLLSEGEAAARILLLHPMRSGWTLFNGTDYTDEFRALDRDFVAACEALSAAHLEYHLGDETIMAGHGSAADGRLSVGRCAYEAVVLPSLRCIAASTLDLLEAFTASGGAVFACGDLPTLLDGVPSARLDAFLRGSVARPVDFPDLAAALRERLGACPRVRDASCAASGAAAVAAGAAGAVLSAAAEIGAIHLTERRFPGRRAWFLVSLDHDRAYRTRVELPGDGILRLYRPEDGSFEDCPHERAGGIVSAVLAFEPMRSRVLVLDETPAVPAPPSPTADAAAKAGAEAADEPFVLGVEGDWGISAVDLNSLTLDSCRCRIDGGPLQNEKPVIALMRELLELRRPCDVELRFSFDCALDPATLSTCFLALERAEEFGIEANGASVSYVDAGWWKDTSFKKIDLLPLLRRGNNEIVLRRRFFQRPEVYRVLFGEDVYETEKNKLTYDVELESVYLVGDFGVSSASPFTPGERNSLHTDGPFSLTELPRRIRAGDLAVQGFPFFAGSISLSREVRLPREARGRRVVLRLNKPRAVLAAVSVDGYRVAALPWAPWEADLTGRIAVGAPGGAQVLTITLWSGNRNLLGPHHHILGEPYNVGPDSFTGRWSWVEKATEAEPARAEDRSRSYWKDGYAFVTFGLVP